MPIGGTPPNPWKLEAPEGELLIFQDPTLEPGNVLSCDSHGRPVPEAEAAGVIMHPDTAKKLWEATRQTE